MRVMGKQGSDTVLQNKGTEILARPHVQKAIQTKMELVAKKNDQILNSEKLLQLLSDIVQNKDPHKVPEFDKFGNPKNQNISMKDRLKAGELLGKSYALFVDRKEVDVKVSLSSIIQDAYEVEDKSEEVEEVEYKEVKTQEKLGGFFDDV